MMRGGWTRELDEICAELGITSSNCGVMLYRARMRCVIAWTATGLRVSDEGRNWTAKEVSRLISEGLDRAMPAPNAPLTLRFTL